MTSGNVDLVGPPSYWAYLCVAPESGSCIDVDGSIPGTITSTAIDLVPGNYTLAFDIDGTQRGYDASTTVTFGSYFNQTYNLASPDQNAISVSFDVTAPGSAPIVFTSNDPPRDSMGTLVDNVSLTQNSTSLVPEPSTLSLMAGLALAALGGIGARRLRRARA